MKRILKQTFVIIITFVLVFAISIPCFADDVKTSPAGFNSWSTQEKVNYLGNTAAQIISSVTGLVSGSGGDGFKQLCLDLYANQPEAGVYSYYEYLANGLSFDDDTETWTLSDDLADFCNQLIVNYNDKVTMMYRYPVQLQNISPETFVNKKVYDAFVAVCQQYPSSYILTSSEPVRNWRGTMYTALDGSKSDGVYDTSWDSFTEIFVISQPLAGVSQYLDLSAATTSFYDDNWEQGFKCITYVFAPDGRWFTRKDGDFYYGSSIGQNWHYTNSIVEIEPFTYPPYDELTNCGAPNNSYSYATFSSSTYVTSLSARTCYTASPNALNVYKTVADMKKDIGSQVVGKYTPDYTGTASNTVTQNTVNNVTNNYYGDNSGGGSGGGSSGSDNSGGGSSGGGIFDDIISGIANGVGSIIKGIFSIIKDLVDAIADAIVSITKSITDLLGLLKGDFTSFLSAVFPFMPQEFIKIMVASLALCLLGVIIKIFRG